MKVTDQAGKIHPSGKLIVEKNVESFPQSL
jgi:hypothetical protein